MDPALLDEHAHLWDGSDPDWVILKGSRTDLPYRRGTGMISVICDDELSAALLHAMRSHGVPVIQSIGDDPGRDRSS